MQDVRGRMVPGTTQVQPTPGTSDIEILGRERYGHRLCLPLTYGRGV
jgi:hypothetical protein